jgi:ATP-dependent helicase HrpB
MQYQKISLPIDAYLNDILKKIQEFSTILIKASPGSGKTTRLPWYLAKNLNRNVIVLEPRRLAAKLAAERIAQEEGLSIGEEVGFHFRFEKRTSSKTQLTFYTEGTFLKLAMLEENLEKIEVVILDEFHERHLETDMALAFLLDLQKKRRDLKIILMSATIDTEITKSLNQSATIEIEAPLFPVDIHYLPNQPSILGQNLETKIKDALMKVPQDFDVLVFLPGMREIQKIQSYLGPSFGVVFILHSEISKEEQEMALLPHSRRKIILSTNIAESSVTIPGIKAVIDSGIQREAHYSPWNGLKLIKDIPTTKSSSIQRAGRAGRTSQGVCYRLYSLQDYEAREQFTPPAITKADLTDCYLLAGQLKSELQWLTPPPKERWEKAKELCFLMGLINESGAPTPLVRACSPYPLDIRLARVLLAGEKLPRQEKKLLLDYICFELENDQSGRLLRRLSPYLESTHNGETSWEKCLVSGFIDQVAKYRPKQNDFIHFSGKSIKLHPSLGNLTEGHYLILDITQRQEAIKILPIEEEWLFDHEPFPFIEEDQVIVEPDFLIRTQTKIGSIVIDEKNSLLNWTTLKSSQRSKALHLGENVFQKRWNQFKETEAFNRYCCWKRLKGEIDQGAPTLSDYFDYSSEMSWGQLNDFFNEFIKDNELNSYLPWNLNVGGKRDLKVHYPFNQDPYIEAPIQDFYGLKETPKISPLKMTLTIVLIGPHKRPLQVTKDLAGFWKKTYQEMLKEFKREYPRHHWPEDPANAKPILLKRMLNEN